MTLNKKIMLGTFVLAFFVMSAVPVCGQSDFGSPGISASPSIVNPGDEITVTYLGAPGFIWDWVAIYEVGDLNEWFGESCYLYGESSGSLTFTAPDEPGDYEFRLLENDGYDDIARSNVVRVQEGTTETPPPTDIAPLQSAAEATLRWIGMAEDKVGKGNQPDPDGDLDGHFALTLIPNGEKTVVKITLLSADESGNHVGGQVWDTVPNYYWILGVEQPSGVRLNPTDKDISKRITTTSTFELYAANSGWFKAGQHFKVKVDFNDGTSIEAVTAVTETPQTPTAEATLRWIGMAEDKVGKGNQPDPDGDLDGHFSLTLIPKGEKTIGKINLLSADESGNHVGGQVWDTVPNYYWILGVEQPSGVRLNPTDKDISKRITTTSTFELYAANSGWFKAGQHFKVKVDFNDGTSIEAVAAVTETPQTPTAEATLRWMGMAEDKVGKGNQPDPDGDLDGHFSLTLIPKGEKTIGKINLLSADESGNHVGGQVWDTVPNYYWILGVEQPSGVRLNPTDKDISKRITTTSTFELYAANSGWFKAGQHFKVKVDFNDGTSIEAVAAVTETPPPLTPPEFSALIFESRSKSSGSTVQIPLTLKGVREDIGNMDITLRYDPSVLEATRVIKGGLTANSVFDYNIPGKGTIKISLSMAGREGFSGDGSIAYIVFDVIGSEGSDSRLDIVSASANRAEDMTPMDIPTQDGVFLVSGVEECRGDCDGDGEITPVDALCALRMAVEKIPEDLVMDMNGDGSVTSLDAREILRKAVATGTAEEPDFEKKLDEIESELEGYSIGELETFDFDNDGSDDRIVYTFEPEEVAEDLFLVRSMEFDKTDSELFEGKIVLKFENKGDKPIEYSHIEEIPKSFAESVDDLEFSVPPDEIIDPDPKVMWKDLKIKIAFSVLMAKHFNSPFFAVEAYHVILDDAVAKCNKMSGTRRDYCLLLLAEQLKVAKPTEVCHEIESEDLKNLCLGRVTGDKKYCEKIKNKDLKKVCLGEEDEKKEEETEGIGIELSRYNRGSWDLFIDGEVTLKETSPGRTAYTHEKIFASRHNVTGEFSGNTFTGSKEEITKDGCKRVTTMRATFDDRFDNLTALHITYKADCPEKSYEFVLHGTDDIDVRRVSQDKIWCRTIPHKSHMSIESSSVWKPSQRTTTLIDYRCKGVCWLEINIEVQ